LYIVGQFSHEDDDTHDSIGVDNISLSGDCFVYGKPLSIISTNSILE